MELSGRVALVTGGATGIGRATVLQLAKAGAAGVVINYRTAKKEAEEVAAEARRLGAKALCVRADVKSDNTEMITKGRSRRQRRIIPCVALPPLRT